MKASKPLAAALLFALPLLGSAQDKPAEPLVQVYGTLNLNLQYTEGGGATDPADDVAPRMAVSTDSSGIGVRGTLGVAHELKAVYQCETSAAVDGEGVSGICNRNSRIGVSGGWGSLFYGNWDTPFKSGHYGTKADDPFMSTDVYGFQGIMGSPGFGTRTSAFNSSAANAVTASFDQRAANSVAYWSPKFSGVGFKVQYSADEFRPANAALNPMLLAAVLNFDMGNLSIVATGEYHADALGLSRISVDNTAADGSSTDYAWRIAAGYDLPLGGGTLNVMGMFEQLIYAQDDAVGAAALTDYDRMAFLVGAKFRTGNHDFRLRYSQALSPGGTLAGGGDLPSAVTDELGAQSFAVGYMYWLAKTMAIYAYYTQIMNGDLASYTFGVAGNSVIVTAAEGRPGYDPMAAGLGLRYAF